MSQPYAFSAGYEFPYFATAYDNEWEPTLAEINRERYHAEIADLEREHAADLAMHAGDLGVSVEALLDAEEEFARHQQCRNRVISHRYLCDAVLLGDDEIPF